MQSYNYQSSMKDDIFLKNFGHRVRDIRKGKNLSQEALASLANLHRTYIGMIERGEKNITLLNIKKISKALNFPLKKLIGGLDEK